MRRHSLSAGVAPRWHCSVLLETAAGQRLRIEGYVHLDELADWLQRHVPAQRVVTAHWYHR